MKGKAVFILALLVGGPELVQAAAPTIRTDWTVPDHTTRVGEPLPFEVQLVDLATGNPPGDLGLVEFTIVRPPGAWQIHVPANLGGPGRYSGSFTPALAGSHVISVSRDRGEGREIMGSVGVKVDAAAP